jgi:nogalaviketone/aklaviketone reductase
VADETEGTTRAVVITGGGTGIGRAAARAFADEGAGVLIVGRTEATLKEAAGDHAGIHPLTMDISAPEAPERIVATALELFGRIDVLVNNAAFIRAGKLGRTHRAETEAQVAINLLAPIYLTQEALGPLTESRGTVINVSSSVAIGQRGWPDAGVYGAAKAGLDYLTRTWAVELGPRGIRVVGLAPGAVETGVHIRMAQTDEQHEKFVKWLLPRIPLGRVAEPEEIARWIVHLTHPDAGYLTGAVLALDGGLSVT